jgi:hypothetical protein
MIRKYWPEADESRSAILSGEQPEQDQWLANQLLELWQRDELYEPKLPRPDPKCLDGASKDLAGAMAAILRAQSGQPIWIRSAHSDSEVGVGARLIFTGIDSDACNGVVKSSLKSPFWLVARAQARFSLAPSMKGFSELLTEIGYHWDW